MTKNNEDEGIIMPFLKQIINSSRMSASLCDKMRFVTATHYEKDIHGRLCFRQAELE